MPYSYTQLPGDGSNQNFTFNFGYLSKSHVSATVDGVSTPFNWITDFSIQIIPAPASGTIVEIRRRTPLNEPIVDWSDGSTLTESDMDLNTLFSLYAAQEAQDAVDASVTLNSVGKWNGQGRSTTNFADPTDPTGLVTKNYFENNYTPALDAKVAAASASASAAATSASQSQGYAALADSHADEAAVLLALFKGQYLGAQASDPTVDGNGQPVTAGDLYFSTTENALRVFTGIAWQNSGSVIQAIINKPVTPVIATGGQTTVSVPGGYDPNYIVVFVNGLIINPPDIDVSSGSSITFSPALSDGDEVTWVAFGAFNVANTYTKAEAGSLFAARVTTIGGVRSLSKLLFSSATVEGYYAKGDLGGGNYYLDTTDTTSTDNGGSVIVASDGGRWKLASTKPLTVRQFGAKGDNASNDAAAFLAADAATGSGNTLVIPKGLYVIGTNITLNSKLVFEGGAMLVISSGVTVTLKSVSAPTSQQIFSGSGTVSGLYGIVYAEWWGAKGDNVQNDSPAFQAAVGPRRILQLLDPPSGYKLASGINLNATNFMVCGVPTRTNIYHAGNFDLFTFNANQDISIRNLWIDSQGVTSAGYWEFRINTTTLSFNRLDIQNVITFQSRGLITDSGGTGSIVTLTLRDVVSKKHSGPGVALTRAFAYIHFHDMTIDFVGSALPSFSSWNLSGAQGILFDNCDVTGSAGAGTGATASQAGFVLNNCAGVWFRKTQADTLEGRGYELIGCSGVQFDDAIAGLCASGVGFYFSNCTDVTGYIRQSGRAGLGYAPAGIHGVAIDTGNTRFRLDIQSNLSTGDGVNIVGITSGLFGSLSATGNVGVGLRSGSSGAFTVGTASFGGNTGGNYDIGGSAHGITRAQLNSGAFVGPITGSASA